MVSARVAVRGFSPLDEELGLLPGVLTPHGHECLVRLSSWMPFRKATELFADFMGIEVNKNLGQRYTETAGAAYEQLQEQEVERLEQGLSTLVEEQSAEKLQISADGAMVPLLHGLWAEVKTLVIGEVKSVPGKDGDLVTKTGNLTYFSRKTCSATFERLALAETHRRGIANVKKVAAIMDGAEWLQGFTDYHCPQATRILDFPHAAEHVGAIGEALHGEHTAESRSWKETRLHQLKHDGPDSLLDELAQAQEDHPDCAVISSNLAYLQKRREQIQYPHFLAQGWPIGSGIVESGNKLVVEARLKGSGMHWHETNVNPMLALRNIICSDRWQEAWPQIETRLRHQVRKRQEKLRGSRRIPVQEPTTVKKHVYLDDCVAKSLTEGLEAKTTDKTHKPNPWRNFKFGKALYQPSPPPKN